MADNKLNEKVANQGNLEYGIKPDMTLYQVSILKGLRTEIKIFEANDEEYGWIIDNQKLGSYELKYFKEYNGINDIIIYSKVGETDPKLVSCYRFDENGICRVRSMEDLKWRDSNSGMVNFVIQMFAAFREHGITFINDSINEITDKYLAPRKEQPKTLRKRRHSGIREQRPNDKVNR